MLSDCSKLPRARQSDSIFQFAPHEPTSLSLRMIAPPPLPDVYGIGREEDSAQ